MKESGYFVFDCSQTPPVFLPRELIGANLVDITQMSHRFRVYLDTKTGKIHDGAEYARQAMELGL